MRHILNILVIFIALFSSLKSFASKAEDAERAYNNGNYAEAISLYNNLLEDDSVSAALYYNLGNAYYKSGENGNAVLAFERAKKLKPHDRQIVNNLNYVVQKVTDANVKELKGKKGNLEYDNPTFFQLVRKKISETRSSNDWACLAVIAFLLFLCFLALYVFASNILARKAGFFGGIAFISFAVIFLILAFVSAGYAESKDDAVIISQKIALLEKPEIGAGNSTVPLHSGTKVEIIEDYESKGGSATWYKVRLNSENIGWINSKDLEII